MHLRFCQLLSTFSGNRSKIDVHVSQSTLTCPEDATGFNCPLRKIEKFWSVNLKTASQEGISLSKIILLYSSFLILFLEVVFLTISVASFERGQLESLANQIYLVKNIYLDELDSCEEVDESVAISPDTFYNLIGPLPSSSLGRIPVETVITGNESVDNFLHSLGYSTLGFRYEQYENGEISCRQKYDFNTGDNILDNQEMLKVDLREDNIFANLRTGFESLYNKAWQKGFVYTVIFDRVIQGNKEVYQFTISSEKVLISFDALFRVILFPSIIILIVNTALITLGSVMFFSRPIERITSKIQSIHSTLNETSEKDKGKSRATKKSIFLEINRIENEITMATERLRPINTLEGEGKAFQHEIKNYMSAIRASLRNLISSLGEDGKLFLEKERSIDTIGKMISTKVEHLVSYVTSDPRNLEKEEISLGKLFSFIKNTGEEVAIYHGVEGLPADGEGQENFSIITINWPPNEQNDMKINANWESLYGVMFNLVLNAIIAIRNRIEYEKDMGIQNGARGKIIIAVQESGDDRMLEISVEDNGAGVEEQIRQTLFEYGVQGDLTITKRDERKPLGGVGLHYSFQQINYHGGELKLDWTRHFNDSPTPARTGARFKITLPR